MRAAAKHRATRRALVTGANGLIGSSIVRRLLTEGWTVRGLVRPNASLASLDGLSVEIVRGDVLVPESIASAMHGMETVFHTATYFAYSGISKDALTELAVRGTLNVLEAAARAGVSRVVLTSSSVVFGHCETPEVLDKMHGLAAADEAGAYVSSKIEQDAAAQRAAEALGLSLIIACPTMTIGPHPLTLGPSNGIITTYLSDPLRLTYAGGCNLVSADDVAAGHVLLAARGSPGEHYLLGSENFTWAEIHALISEIAGTDGPRYRVGHTVSYLAASLAEFEGLMRERAPLTTRQQADMVGRYYWYGHGKAAACGYRPAPPRDALAQTIAWLVTTPHISRETRAGLRLSPEAYAARKRTAPIAAVEMR